MSAVVDVLRNTLRGRSDVQLALLFGSSARGSAREDSDVDVAVVAPGADLLALAVTLGAALDREVDLIALQDATIPLLGELVRDAIVVHEGQPGAHARWRSHALITLETDGPWYRRMRDAFIARLASAPDRG
jgi:predicted nucleotidyltransferase